MNIVNQQEKQLFSKKKNLYYYFAGFIEGEGCFSVSIKRKEGMSSINLGACRFVPLIGEGAWDEE